MVPPRSVEAVLPVGRRLGQRATRVGQRPQALFKIWTKQYRGCEGKGSPSFLRNSRGPSQLRSADPEGRRRGCVGSTESARRRAGAGAGAELLPRERGAVLGAAPPPGPAGQGGPRPCRAGRSASPFPGRAVLRVHSHRVQRGDGCENASAWTGRPPVRHGCDSSCLAGSPGCPGGGPGPARRPQARRMGSVRCPPCRTTLRSRSLRALESLPSASRVIFVWRLRRFPFSVAAWAPSPQPQPSPLGPWGARCRRGGRASCPPALAGVDSTSSRSRGHFPSVPWKRG